MIQYILPPKDKLADIGKLATPIVLAMLSQNIFNIVDTAMVGYLGDASLAAVGLGSFLTFCFFAILLGLAVSVQSTSARRMGEGEAPEAAINIAIRFALWFGVPYGLILYLLAGTIFPFLNSDPTVIKEGVAYLEPRMLGVAAVGINAAFRGFWNGISKPKVFFQTLVIVQITNIFLNYVLIFGEYGFPQLGTAGAGYGTLISQVIGSLIYFFLYRRSDYSFGYTEKGLRKPVLKMSFEAGIQQVFFAGGFTVFYWIIGKIGTAELAVSNVIVNIILIGILPAIGLGQTTATFVSRSLGEKNVIASRVWPWEINKVSVMVLLAIGLPMVLYPRLIGSFFIHDPRTLELLVNPLRLNGACLWIDAVALNFLHALQGAGDTKTVLKISFSIQWLIFLPAAYMIGPVLGYGLLGVWTGYWTYRAIIAIIFIIMWKRGSWEKISV